jgi:D-glycero-alpha-D-manno-heptose-7-phosphate kinase
MVGSPVMVTSSSRSGPAFGAAAPVRLDLAGGWTDVPPFSVREGGVVVTVAIQLFAKAEVRLGGSGFRLVSEELNDELEVVDSAGLVRDGRLDLLKAGLRMLPVGGCTVTTRSDAPPGSGLGSSGALDVALVAALSAARGESPDPVEIAETACHLEAVEAGIPGGRQDQFTASHGGFLRLDFRDPDAEVQRLKLDSGFMTDLARRTVLCYTGSSHLSGSTISRVMRAYEDGDRKVGSALHGLRDVAEAMTEALVAADTARIGRLLTENWKHQQALDQRMRTAPMARLERAMADAGALGGKAAGSGAGGCMFFLGPDDPAPLEAAARACDVRLLPVRWAMRGVYQC